MINVSKQWNDREQERNLIVTADITLKDGQKFTTDLNDVMQGGLQIEDGVSAQGSFDLGAAIIGKAVLLLNNYDEKFSMYDFSGAEIRPKISLYIEGKLIETIKKGVYIVDSATSLGNVIRLECLDRMEYFDRVYDTTLNYPASLSRIVDDACVNCGVPLQSASFFNSSYIVSERPTDTEMTYREIISYVAQLAGCFARMNNEGELELKWYDTEAFPECLDGGDFQKYELENQVDGGNFTDYGQTMVIDGGDFKDLSKYHSIYAYITLDVSTDDIIITGCKLIRSSEDREEEYVYGEDGYMLTIENNPLAQENLQSLVESISSKIIGMKFRPLSVQALSDPTIEAGDAAMVMDRKGNAYPCYFTNLSYTIGSYETYTCDAKTEGEQKSVRYSPYTKIERKIKTEVNQKLNGFEQQFSQFNELMANAMGFYQSIEKQDDGSIIAYIHNKPQLADSETIWKISVDGFGVSLDGGKTWTTGITKDGNIIANVLSVVGINADWITAGIINAIEMIGCTIRGSYIESKSGNDRTIINNGTMITNRIILENESDTSNSGYLTPSVLVLASSNGNRVNIDTSNGYVQLPSNGFFNVGSASLKTDELQLGIRSGKTRPIINGMEIPYAIDLQNNYVNRDKYNEDLKYIYENYTLKAIFDLHTHNSTAINAIPYTGTEIDSLGVSTGYIDFNNADAAGFYYVKRISAKVASMNTSDFRLKKDFQKIDGIENVYLSLKPYNYRFKECSDFYNKKIHSGVLAQEVIKNFEENGLKWTDYDLIETFKPDSELSDEGQYVGEQGYRVNYNNLHAWHIYMIQQQQRQINNLQEESKVLKNRLDQIEELLLNKSEVNS